MSESDLSLQALFFFLLKEEKITIWECVNLV